MVPLEPIPAIHTPKSQRITESDTLVGWHSNDSLTRLLVDLLQVCQPQSSRLLRGPTFRPEKLERSLDHMFRCPFLRLRVHLPSRKGALQMLHQSSAASRVLHELFHLLARFREDMEKQTNK